MSGSNPGFEFDEVPTAAQWNAAFSAKQDYSSVLTALVAANGRLPRASYQAQPANPTGTASTTAVMMGLSGEVTPILTGNIQIIISGNIANAIAIADGGKVQIRYGTGAAPANANALTGTAAGAQPTYIVATTASVGAFVLNAIIVGLTVNTAYWIDVSLAAVTGGTAAITNVSISVTEV